MHSPAGNQLPASAQTEAEHETGLMKGTDVGRAAGARIGHKEVCIVGAGPRGLSVLERLLANERSAPRHASLAVHLIDPFPPGSGAVWRTEQSPHLLMNTVASQVTVFTDASSRIDGPIEPGPSLYRWAKALVDGGSADPDLLTEATALGPDSYPSRAFYGHYLRHMFERVVSGAPGHVTIRVHRTRAVALSDATHTADGLQTVLLADGGSLRYQHTVVLAQGHVPARLLPKEQKLAEAARAHRLTYVPPSNPADVELDDIDAGEAVVVRGLGLNFFDYLALFTHGRGGAFVRTGDGRLEYRPSGSEPRMYAFSRRGVPYHARGENEKGASQRHMPVLVTPERIGRLRSGGDHGIDFKAQLWPLISWEVESVYYATLLSSRGSPEDAQEFTDRFLSSADPAARDRVLDAFGVSRADRWDWQRIADPCRGRMFADRKEFTGWLTDYLVEDVREARRGNLRGPRKAALDILRDLRNEIRLAVDYCGLDGRSHRDDLDAWYTPLNAFLSIGPPAVRIEEMIALIDAGVLCVTGPGTRAGLDREARAFTAWSARVPGPPVHARVLIDARLPVADLRHTADPLLRDLITTGGAACHRVPSATGSPYETGGLSVASRTFQLLDAKGRAHPRRLVYGVPTESVRWVTAAGIRPGVDSVTLADADAIARAVLGLVPTSPHAAKEHP